MDTESLKVKKIVGFMKLLYYTESKRPYIEAEDPYTATVGGTYLTRGGRGGVCRLA
jgi:hypothetical protein